MAAVAFTGCGWRGRRSIERTLSVMSSWEPSTLEPSVAELQDASRSSDARTKPARTARRIVGERTSVPTRTIELDIQNCIGGHQSPVATDLYHLCGTAVLAAEHDRNKIGGVTSLRRPACVDFRTHRSFIPAGQDSG